MKKLKRIPISIILAIIMMFAFTFITYDWIMSMEGRMFYVSVVGIGGVVLEALNADFKFWKYKP